MSASVGRTVAKAVGIDLSHRDPVRPKHDGYVETEPTAGEWLRGLVPSWLQVGHYFYSIFPFLQWIMNYNMQWFMGDLIAGVTVGAVVIPQGMAYAVLAKLPAEYGLYTSFMGVLIYWFFATSKDITIGPVAVMSTLVGTIIIDTQKKHPDIPAPVIAEALAVISGAIVAFIGFARLGFIVDFIPLPAITAFMTGSAINVAAGQVKTVLGETNGFSTRGATYMVIIDTLKYLPTSQMDAAMGLTALAMLYAIRSACNYASRKMPHRAKLFFFLSTLRTVFVILFYTMISAAVNLHRRDDPAFKLLGTVPRGFKHAGVPKINTTIIKAFASELPAAVIILVIEHIAISKSFGRVNNYTINPSQEFIAIGISNLLGPFLGAYPATGSFSRTAIKAKAGVRTPLAGVITAIIVLLAIYALPALFYYIPSSSLSAVIIHAVGDLIAPPRTIYQYWRVAPLDAFICVAGIIIIIFTTIEIGIYCTICISLAVLLFRTAKARGQFLGQATIHSVVGDHLLESDPSGPSPLQATPSGPGRPSSQRTVFLPLSHADGSNPAIPIAQPAPGVFIYQLSEGFNYPNANHYTDHLVAHIFATTRRTDPALYARPGDRPWNDPGPRKGQPIASLESEALPTLRAVILDFSAVNNVDVSSVQNLIDVRNQLDRYAAPDKVQWHFAHITNRWTKRALAAAGFGLPPSDDEESSATIVFTGVDITHLPGSESRSHHPPHHNHNRSGSGSGSGDLESSVAKNEKSAGSTWSITEVDRETHSAGAEQGQTGSAERKPPIVNGVNWPFFHVDLTSALESATQGSWEERGPVKHVSSN
ncbi:sulfate permease [Aspergillus heteromorphus CBS 117.55]|uniref:Sulfate permease n=1 Tax=Aspergillus heteromorphus CBS 117.55 TaxID=1448321 RepID=A0A317WV67_9EURO|nr:sulfate permease [Aspergillus heteromorphus CBS 117.55]PWY89202.1 sulfate permease [Aspergillus heteromorphus CBS 117.55]